MARIGTALLGGCLPWSAGIGGGVHRQPPPRPRVQAQPLKAAAAIIPKVKSIRCSRVSPPGVTKEEEEAMLSPRQFSFFGVDMVDKDALAYTKLKPKGFLVAGGHLMITDLSDCIETLLENEDRWIHTCYSEYPTSGFGKAFDWLFDFENGPFMKPTKEKSKNIVRCTQIFFVSCFDGPVAEANIKTREDFKKFLLQLIARQRCFESKETVKAVCSSIMVDAESLKTVLNLHSII
ncbi:unnamed protein product [Cuscuta europaea]|uniref:Uncharacterized protein n=1 Tax=Cuscuta europaea TaxID=41803 RepID=A0A9P1ENG1_CUSEU|nr:unnamed protein product [Cuscuta europaea]